MSASEPPLPELMASLRREAMGLALSELELAKAEVRARAKQASAGVVPAMIGLVALQTGFLALCTTAIVGLGDAMSGRYAMAALIVGLIFVAASAIAFFLARKHFLRAAADTGIVPGQAMLEVLHGRHRG
ncbi:MAG: phage holin family protein [Myxococcota bacterium]